MFPCCTICRDKNDDYYHKRREGGGQRVMIEIIISENDDNDGRPLSQNGVCWHKLATDKNTALFSRYQISPKLWTSSLLSKST